MPVKIRILQNTTPEYEGMIENASADGVFLFVRKIIPERSRVQLSVDLTTEDDRAVKLWFSGEVVRVQPGSSLGVYGMAVAAADRAITYC